MKRKDILKNIALLCATIIILLVFVEIIARLTYPLYANYNTEMWRYAKDLKMPSSNPLVSHVHRPNTEADLYGAHVRINSEGWRDYEYDTKKGEDTYRILVLGDSITFGWGVELNNTFSKIVEKRFNQEQPSDDYRSYEVINTGVGNYNTVMELQSLKEKGMKYDPDLIILGYYINDAEMTHQASSLQFLKRSYFYAFIWDKYQNMKTRYIEGTDYQTFYSNLYQEGFEGKIQAENSLRELIAITKENNITLLIIIFPEFHNFVDYEFNKTTQFVTDIGEEYDVQVLDLLPYYKDHAPESIWVSYEDAHPNALGNYIAADAIYTTLTQRYI